MKKKVLLFGLIVSIGFAACTNGEGPKHPAARKKIADQVEAYSIKLNAIQDSIEAKEDLDTYGK